MDRLARVEIQLIMNCLTRTELTHLSRCSRRLLSDGDTDLAWCTQPIYELPEISSGALEKFLSPPLSASLFMRHMRFSFELPDGYQAVIVAHLTRVFESVTHLVRISFVNLMGLHDGCPIWQIVHQTHLLSQLTECHFDCTSDLKLSQLLAGIKHLSNLRSLILPWNGPFSGFDFTSQQSDSVIGLREFHLTNLKCTDAKLLAPQEDEGSTISTSIMKCEGLTHLFINELRLSAIEFNRVFTSSYLSQLKELFLDQWAWMDKKQAASCMELLSATWRSMTRLERLTLCAIDSMTQLVRTLKSFGPNFKFLSIFAHDSCKASFSPSSLSLEELLITHPHLTIETEDENDGEDDDQDDEVEDEDEESNSDWERFNALGNN